MENVKMELKIQEQVGKTILHEDAKWIVEKIENGKAFLRWIDGKPSKYSVTCQNCGIINVYLFDNDCLHKTISEIERYADTWHAGIIRGRINPHYYYVLD